MSELKTEMHLDWKRCQMKYFQIELIKVIKLNQIKVSHLCLLFPIRDMQV